MGNRQVPDQSLNTSNNSQLFSLRIDGTGINSVDLSNNPLLTNVRLDNARLTTSVMDQVLIDLDGHGLSGGSLQIANQTTGESISVNALTAYNNLIAKGWTIDVAVPVTPSQQTITMTSTSSNAIWQLARVTNSGLAFEWEASNSLIGTLTATGNAPLFDFSSNDGSQINITVTSPDEFIGLTQLDLNNIAGGESSFITYIDISSALNLTTFAPVNSSLTGIDVSQNLTLQRLFIVGNRQVPDQSLNTSNNAQLFSLRIDGTGINSVDLSNNPLLTNVQLNNARLTSSVLDQSIDRP